MRGLRLTRRGVGVVYTALALLALAAGFFTARWTWGDDGYTYYGDDREMLEMLWEMDTASDH